MRYVAGTDLTLTIPLVDQAGKSITASAVSYSVLDSDGGVLAGPTALAGFVSGAPEAIVTILAAQNTLAAGSLLDAREVSLKCTTDNGFEYASFTYIIESVSGRLVKGGNTFISIATADLLIDEMSWPAVWKTANRQDKTNALQQAYSNLCKLRYPLLSGEGMFCEPTGLAEMSVSEVLALDSKFYSALSKAQAAEAAYLLETGDEESKQDSGLILDAIGEVKQMYRGTKSASSALPVSKRAIAYLTKYAAVGSKVIART